MISRSSLKARANRAARQWMLARRGLSGADRILTHTTPAERDMLYCLGRRKAGGIGVEVGTAFGASSCFIAAGIRHRNGVLYCVDKWNIEYRQEGAEIINYIYHADGTVQRYEWNDADKRVVYTGAPPGDCPIYQQFLSNTRAFSAAIRPIRKDSVEAAMTFTVPIDLLFIDGWHEYDAVRRDVEAWLPKVASGGIVIFHDYGWAEGVRRVVHEDVMPRIREHASLPNMFWGAVA